MALRAWVYLLMLSGLWASSFMFNALALEQYGPLTVAFLRVGLGALTLLSLALFTGLTLNLRRLDLRRSWPVFLLLGCVNNVIPFSLIVGGQTLISSGLASVVNASTPFFALLIAALVLKEIITLAKLLGLTLGAAGVGMLALPGLGLPDGDILILGILMILGASLSYGIAAVAGKVLLTTPAMASATGMLCASTLVSAVVMLAVEGPITTWPTVQTALSVGCLGVLCSALAYGLYFEILKLAGPVSLSLVTLLIPPGALLLGAMVLGEDIRLTDILGLALILTGLIVLDSRVFKLMRLRQP